MGQADVMLAEFIVGRKARAKKTVGSACRAGGILYCFWGIL